MKFLLAAGLGLTLATAALGQAGEDLRLAGFRPPIAGEDPLLLRLETWATGYSGRMSLAADDVGGVWLTTKTGGPCLARFQHGRWQVVKIPGFADTMRAAQVLRLASGWVACLWLDSNKKSAADPKDAWALSMHRGEEHSRWCVLDLKSEWPRLLALADGGLLITESGRRVLRIHPDRKLERFELPESLYVEPQPRRDGHILKDHVQVHAVQDPGGKIWLWSYSLKLQQYLWRLRGLIRFDEGSFHLEKLGDLASATRLSAVVPWDDGTLAVAAPGMGLFQFDPRRQSLQQMLMQSDELKYIEKIFRARGDWHFITTPRPPEIWDATRMSQPVSHFESFHDPRKRHTSVLRLRKGKLEVFTRELDIKPEFGWADRPVVETPKGFWICGKDNGLFFASQKEDGRQEFLPYYWRNGFPLPAPRSLVPASGGLLVAADESTASAVAFQAEEPPPVPLVSRVEALEASSFLIEEPSGGIFGVLEDCAFHRWKAGRWEKAQGPANMHAMSGNELVKDDAGQAWFIPQDGGMAAVYDLATGKWQDFGSLKEALLARLKPGNRLYPKKYRFPSAVTFAAGSSTRIGLLRGTDSLNLWDGGQWRTWRLGDFAGHEANIYHLLRFDEGGRLEAPSGSVWWRLEDSGQWTRTEKSTVDAEPLPGSRAVKPANCPMQSVGISVYDRMGVYWFTDNQNTLWKCVHGIVVPVLQSGEISPVPQRINLQQALIDDEGTAFLRIQSPSAGPSYLVVRPRLPLPESLVRLKDVEVDTARLELGDADWHVWRMDGGPWSQATQQKGVVLSSLLPGTHEMEVMAYNADLMPAPKSARIKLTIRAADQGDINRAISAFRSGDLEASETAARRLRLQGDDILPMLREARKAADERTGWWLDAVIQHVERKHP